MPQLPLDAVLRSRFKPAPDTPGTPDPLVDPLAGMPVAICENQRVLWCNQQAGQAGIQPGMSEANAHALAGALQPFARNVRQEAQALQEAALWALRFTPHVTLRDSGLLLEVGASLRLFKGAQALAARLYSGLVELGLQVRLAGAPTATGAWWRAQCDGLERTFEDDLEQALDPLPPHVLDTARPHLETLDGIGCDTVGQLRRLPRTGLTRRFGGELLRELDRAYGKEAEVHQWFTAPPDFDATLELPARVENTEALLFAARRLLLQLTAWLMVRHAAVIEITLVLRHESTRQRHQRNTPLTIVLGTPSRDIEHLSLLLRERLGRLELVAPVVEIALKADRIVLQAAPNTELFPTPASDAESTGRLVERLQSRLGADAVRELAIVADHRPERSVVMAPVGSRHDKRRHKNVPGDEPGGAPCNTPMRPAWLLQQPLALMTRQHKPFYQSPLSLLAGPERIESGWWDDGLAARDYFIAQNDQHALLWVFRLRAMDEAAGSGWFLHGFFA